MPEEISLTLADGVRLHAEAHGPADAQLTVLLLHGWTLDGRTWHRQVDALVTALGPAVRIVTYDARGHGRSGAVRRRTATLAHLGDDLAELLAHLAPTGPVLLGGHSMGGMTIMEYAHRHPTDFATRVSGLVFVSTTAEGHTHTGYGLPARLARLIRTAEIAGAGVLARCGPVRTPRPLLDALRPTLRWLLFGDTCDPADVALTTAAVARARLSTIGGFRASIGAQQRLATLARLARIPAVALVGDRDRLTPPPCAQSIATALVGAEVTVCPGAGHMLMLERAAEVTAALHTLAHRLLTEVPTTGPALRLPPQPGDPAVPGTRLARRLRPTLARQQPSQPSYGA